MTRAITTIPDHAPSTATTRCSPKAPNCARRRGHHRDHAIIEQVIADLLGSAWGVLTRGAFTANAAWLVCAAISHNLTRAAAALASTFHARTRTGTIRAQLINTPARIARTSARLVLHLLPRDWP